jgi:hypothetical protein
MANNSSENTLGETIWLSGETEVGDAKCQGIADELVASLLKNTKFTARLVNEDKLLKIPLFEYEISQGNQPNKLYRILVWIDNQAISTDIPAVYDALFGSLWTRHKIEYVYSSSRYRYRRRSRLCGNPSRRLPLNRKTFGFALSSTSYLATASLYYGCCI